MQLSYEARKIIQLKTTDAWVINTYVVAPYSVVEHEIERSRCPMNRGKLRHERGYKLGLPTGPPAKLMVLYGLQREVSIAASLRD